MTENTELSEREVEILRLVATGASNKEIAQRLYISANTVKVHLRNIFSKIGATTRTEAAMYAVQTGLVSTGVDNLESRAGEDEDQAEVDRLADLSTSSASRDGSLATPLHSQVLPAGQTRQMALLPWAGASVLIALVLILWMLAGGGGIDPPAPAAALPTETPRWQAHSPLSVPRFGQAMAVYENRIYALGGEAAGGVTGTVERYDPQTDAWEPRSTKPVPAADIAAGVIAGKFYIPGGRLAGGSVSDVLEIYDPSKDSWSRGASLPSPLSAYASVVFEGKLYLFGGWDGRQNSASTLRYDPEQDRWENMQPMPTARSFAGAAVAEGKIFVLGGSNGQNSLAVNEIYWPAREGSADPAWTPAADLPAGRFAMGVASVVDVIYLVGGESELEEGVIPLAFVPAQDQWQEFQQPQSLPWSRMGVALLGSQLYVLGGRIDQQPTGQNLAYKAIYTVSIPSIIKDQ